MPRKPTAIDVLRMMDVINRQRKSPSMEHRIYPDKAIIDNSANKLTGAVIKFINLSGYFAERINNQGRRVDNTKVMTTVTGFKQVVGSVEWQKGTGVKGTADISAIVEGGLSLRIEIKFNKDRQSDDQKTYEGKVNELGGIYLIVRTFEQFMIWWSGKYGRPAIMQQAIDKIRTK